MKKIIPYILIVVFALSFFGTAKIVNAGFCITSSGAISGGEVSDKSACKAGETFQEFKPVAPATPPSTTKEICIDNNGANGKTKENCTGKDDRWVQVTDPSTVQPKTLVPASVNTDTKYTPLAPLPGMGMDANGNPIPFDTKSTKENPCAFGQYLDIMIKIFIGISAVLAMLMIVLGGLEYMTSELISSKEHGKERIRNAILGLLIALGAYAILNTINPKLLNKCLDTLPQATIVIKDEPETGIQGKTITTKKGLNLTACDPSQMVYVNIFGSSVEVNKGVSNSLRRINIKWLAMPESTRYKVSSIGGYDCREVTNKPGFWSAHAYGLALDINPNQNPYGSKKITDMPPSFRQLFIEEGWGWGGNWSSVFDTMHFSKFPPNEGGDGELETY